MLLFGLLLMSIFSIHAQDFTKSSDSDPEAKAILKQLKAKYDAYKSMEAQITLEIEIPEQPKEVQQGSIARSGDKYRFKIANQAFISDGVTLWIILGNNKEVQISEVPDEEEETAMISPQTLFSFYEGDKFIYYLTNEMMDEGKLVQQIEFKPTDEYADYSKLRMTIDKKKQEIIRVKAFGKDGTRYTFKLNGMNANKTFPASYFTFKKEDYPGYTIVDLR
jgi:outer membrane lipoprotein-sorting protein